MPFTTTDKLQVKAAVESHKQNGGEINSGDNLNDRNYDNGLTSCFHAKYLNRGFICSEGKKNRKPRLAIFLRILDFPMLCAVTMNNSVFFMLNIVRCCFSFVYSRAWHLFAETAKLGFQTCTH